MNKMNNSQNFSQDYLDDILVLFAHHSSGIEGNTISLPATVSILLNGTLPLSGKATVREFYEIENHKRAFEKVWSYLSNEEPLTEAIIKSIHTYLMDRLLFDRGQFKANDNMILGAEFQMASPSETPFLMQQLVDNLTYRLEISDSDEDKLLAILDSHIRFERIHPFSDGNGRTGRMVLNYSLLKHGFPPLIIEKETKSEYFDFLGSEDIEGFFQFAKNLLEKEKMRMQGFQNMEQEKIKFPK